MKKNEKKKDDSIDAGFSFVETLAVLAVTAILASQIGGTAYSLIQKAKVSAARTQIETIRTALQNFYIDVGRFPENEEGLDVLWENQTDLEKWKGPYIEKKLPKDPWGNDYVYFDSKNLPQSVPEGLPFGIASYGCDGIEGGSEYDADIYSWEEE